MLVFVVFVIACVLLRECVLVRVSVHPAMFVWMRVCAIACVCVCVCCVCSVMCVCV